MNYFLYALALAFIVLKLTNYIDWSWWWVLLPLYGGVVLAVAVYAIAYVIAKIVQ